VCKSLDEAVTLLTSSPFNEQIERLWVIGGSSIYEVMTNLITLAGLILI
jgi:dihydrofolate reductase